MRSGSLFRSIFVSLLAAGAAAAAVKVGEIEFFGASGLDTAKVRAALPLQEGENYSDRKRDRIRAAVLGAIGKEPTDVASGCCDAATRITIYIGLPGANYRPFANGAAPSGDDRLPEEALKLGAELDKALQKAVLKGGDAASEDDSEGYALLKDPATHAVQLKYREWAVAHVAEVLKVLAGSRFVEQRRVASILAGYMTRSPEQTRALVAAVRDPDGEVRNNATRAIEVLLTGYPKLAAELPADPFIEMLSSGIWTDRNKASIVLMRMTDDRDAALLAQVKERAFDSLVEMASWRNPGHAWFARLLLGRIAGIPEDKLRVMASKGPDEVLVAVGKKN